MSKQLRLFYEIPHYEPDCFLSGDPRFPDPFEEPIRYDTWKDRIASKIVTLGVVESSGVLEFPIDNVVELFPKEAA